jgi:hypothetical protein
MSELEKSRVFREMGAHYLALSRQSHDRSARALLLEMATRWHELSNAVDPNAALTHKEAEIYQCRFDDGMYGPLG